MIDHGRAQVSDAASDTVFLRLGLTLRPTVD